jgi:hypothetical protein
MLPRGHLHALKIEKVFLAGLQIIGIKRADDFLSVDRVSGIDRSS